MTTTIISDVLTYALVACDGKVVAYAAIEEIDTTALGRGGVVTDDTGRSMGAIDVDFAACRAAIADAPGIKILIRILMRRMADGYTTSDTAGIVNDIGAGDAAIVVDTYSTTISLHDADAGRLTGVNHTTVYETTAVQIHTTATHDGRAMLNNASAQCCSINKIGSTTIGGMVTGIDILRGCVTASDGAAVDAGRLTQWQCMVELVGVAGRDESFYSEPDNVVGVT